MENYLLTNKYRRCYEFIRSSPYAINEVHYGNIATERLLTPTQDTRDIVAAAQRALRRIWRDGLRYMKAGVMLNDFSGKEAQWVLFDDLPPRPNSAALMSVLDRINQSARGQIWFAGQGVVPSWQMKRQMLSPAYTTRWNELPTAVVR